MLGLRRRTSQHKAAHPILPQAKCNEPSLFLGSRRAPPTEIPQTIFRQESFVSLLVLFHFIFTLPCQVGHLVNLNVHRHLLHHFVRITIPKSRISQVSAPCLQPCQPPYQRPPLQLHSFFIWSECHYHQGHAGS